ncbi:MAG: hypothetical protein HKN23_14320 [Verrucomicrobiales bacterium]|nr:hypothetical protein [Verrucomicrobiales bacterium]
MADIQALTDAVAQNPADWETRCALTQAYYEAEDYENAANTILGAPEVPADEENILFTATVISAIDPDQAHGLLDSFLESEDSEAARELKAQLYEAAGDEASAAAVRGGGAPVAAISADDVVEEDAPAVPAPVPLSPRKLTPPGQDAEASVPPPVAAPAISAPAIGAADAAATPPPISGGTAASAPPPAIAPPPLGVNPPEDDVEEVTLYALDEEGDRALIVGEGEAVHAAEKEPDAKEKVSALTVAILVHVLIAIGFAFVAMAQPRPNPPQISVSALANTDESSLETQTVTKMTQRSASAVASAQPVVSAQAFSNLAMPEVTDISEDLTMVSMSNSDAGFGMSMSGFGDVSNMGAIPASMRSRCSMSQRMQRLRESGGQDRAEKSVRKALDWMTATQNKDGSFGKKYKCAMTGLVLLAYLGHCETPESPKYGDSVVKAATWLMKHGRGNDGRLAMESTGHAWVYEHGIATYALCELYTMTKESGKEIPGLKTVLTKSVGLIVKGQTDLGGWAYGYSLNPGGDDMSVAGWQVQALKAAYNTGEKFRGLEDALDNAMAYIAKIQDGEGAFKYRPDNAQGKRTLTGAALLSMQVWGEMGSPTYEKGMNYLSGAVQRNPPLGRSYYEPYYNTQAFFLHGGDEWEEYNKNFQNKLLDAQNADGSWTGPNMGGHGGEDSHHMNTAWGCLMLEVYYRYLPTTDKVKDLKPR